MKTVITFGTFAQVFGAVLAAFGIFIGFAPVAIVGAAFALWGLIALHWSSCCRC